MTPQSFLNLLAGEALSADMMRCSFCEKSKAEVARMFAGAKAYICNECVELCREMLSDEGFPVDGSKSTEISNNR